MTILEAIDRGLLGRHCQGATWDAWRAFLAALFGLPLTAAQRALYREHAGRQTPPTAPAREAWVVVGRRGGKSAVSAVVGTYLACFVDYAGVLAPGERGTFAIIAADRRQARTVFRYLTGLFDTVPLLGKLVVNRTSETIELVNGINIEVMTCSFRTVRGYTIIGAVLDECAFYRDDTAANPDVELLHALRPAMSTVPGALLLGIRSPYARRGILWNAYKDHYGRDGDPVLVWQAPSRAMNPRVPEQLVRDAYAEDEAAAAAEYGAQFRRDVEMLLTQEAVDAVTIPGRLELPPLPDTAYTAFVDPSGGSQDSMTLAIAHHEHGVAVLDAVRERRPPFSPESVVEEFAALLKPYRVSSVTGDRYGLLWPQERCLVHRLQYEVSEQTKSELFGACVPLVHSGKVALLDHPRLRAQLVTLERRTSRAGRDSISHPVGGRDDLANAVAGALVAAAAPPDIGEIRAVNLAPAPRQRLTWATFRDAPFL